MKATPTEHGWLLEDCFLPFVPAPPLEFFNEGLPRDAVAGGRENFEGRKETSSYAQLPSGEIVFLELVGRNASHNFHMGQTQDGRLFKACGCEQYIPMTDMKVGEGGTYMGNCEFSVWRIEMHEIDAMSLDDYWGHY